MASEQEAEWIRRIALGDREAFENLFRSYQRRIFAYLYGLVGRAETAEELTSDVLVEVWKNASRFRGDSRPSTWIFGIARYKALSALRRPELDQAEEKAAAGVADPAMAADERLAKEAVRRSVREALARLSPAHREVIELTFYHGFSCQEIAQIVKRPVNTVKTRMFHARRRLHEILEARGIKGAEG